MTRTLLQSAIFVTVAASFVGACGAEDHDHDNDHDHDHDAATGDVADTGGSDTGGSDTGAPDAVADTAMPDVMDHDAHDHDAHGAETMDVSLRFAMRAGEADVACGSELVLGSDATTVTVTDARFYVHGVHLLNAQGDATPVVLEQDETWQIDDIALLDFEDGTATCANGNELLNNTVRGTVPAGEYTGIRFTLGIPQERNHQLADTAPAPLSYTSMWWNWQGGYKFVRFDADNSADGLFFHLGSTGCTGEPPEIEGCARPNRPEITLEGYNPDESIVVFDVQTLWAGAPAATNTEGTRPGCMSAPDDPECGPVLATLGLDDNGLPTEAQTVFSVAAE